MKKLLTLKRLKRMKPRIFAHGYFVIEKTTEHDLSGSYLWVACRGMIWDWAIYFAPSVWTKEQVQDWGEKMRNKKEIQDLVPCDEEALKMYRY